MNDFMILLLSYNEIPMSDYSWHENEMQLLKKKKNTN